MYIIPKRNGYLEVLSPAKIADSVWHAELEHDHIVGGWNYALDHAWLYKQIAQYCAPLPSIGLIIDAGCGNSMFHPWLEKQLSCGIIGVDRIKGLCPHPSRTNIMDFCGDLRHPLIERRLDPADIIFWCSSIEHNAPGEQRECVSVSLSILNNGGLFLATFGLSLKTHYYEPSQQWNLSAEDAADLYGVEWKEPPDFDAIVKEYRSNVMDLDTKHRKRYGTDEYAFVVAGVRIVK